ncbi:hypothetical protein Goklo_014222, partial [Gossypium klotzschianum]|nr:hypothetical protein [Gossypium klotzschianum]
MPLILGDFPIAQNRETVNRENIGDRSRVSSSCAMNNYALFSHFNPIYKGNSEVPVSIEKSILYSNKHSVVVFKENVQPNSLGDMGEGQATEVASGFADIGVRIIGGKFNGGQRGKKLNRTIRFNGPSFTWQRAGTFERLDRALGNEAWVQAFSNWMVTRLTRLKSDHQPLIINFNPALPLPKGRSFKFLMGWAQHPSFNFVNENWKYNGDMFESLLNLIASLK